MTDAPTKATIVQRPSVWREHRVALLVAAIAGAVIGGTLVFYALKASGDEAPIRVKNGSLDFQLARQGAEWKKLGNSGNWQVKDGTRANDALQVTVAPGPDAKCTGPLAASGSKLTVTFTDGGNTATIDVQSDNKKLKVKPQGGATLDTVTGTPEILRYGTSGRGYISALALDNVLSCTFTSSAQLIHALILDY